MPSKVLVYRHLIAVKKFTLKITNPLLQRVVIFLCFFVLISGLLGTRIISGGLIFKDGFGIYGGLGKAAMFGLIAFVLLVRHMGFMLAHIPWRPVLLWWGVAALLLFGTAWLSISSLLAGDTSIFAIVGAHAGLVLSVACVAIACFGPRSLLFLWRFYGHEFILSGAIAGLFFVFLQIVYALWQPLAQVVLGGVHGLLALTNIQTTLVMPNILLTDKFGITIAEYCSGIESIALFSGLYIMVGLLDRGRLNVWRYAAVFPVALIILFGLNIVRVFVLIVAGYYINADIAFSLFHTYAGMVFFILYSAVFWLVAYKYLVIPAKVKHENSASR